MAQTRILFVCLGNICRSPTAEAVVRELARRAGQHGHLHLDSAGTHAGYHEGDPPDPRAQQHGARRGYDLSALRARRVSPRDFHSFDLLLAMDQENQDWLSAQCPPEHRTKVRRMMEFASVHRSMDVPDPYYGGPAGFEVVLDYLEDAGAGLLQHIAQQTSPRGTELPEENLTKKLGFR